MRSSKRRSEWFEKLDEVTGSWDPYMPRRPAQRSPIDPVTVKDQLIRHLFPSYTNTVFQYPQTTYLLAGQHPDAEGYVPGAEYQYSDRIFQEFGSKAYSASTQVREQFGDVDTALRWEAYLRIVYDAPNLELVHTQSTYDWGSGHPIAIFGFFKDGLPKK